VKIPSNALVLLVGPAGSGKSTFARRHFAETEVVSSDRCRALVGDDASDQSVSGEAFVLLRTLVRLRLRLKRLTVVDSTAVQHEHRRSLLRLGRSHAAPVIALLFDVDAETCKRRNRGRERRVPEEVIDLHRQQFLRTLDTIFAEGFDAVCVLADAAREPVALLRR
jgi:protein phosphatase